MFGACAWHRRQPSKSQGVLLEAQAPDGVRGRATGLKDAPYRIALPSTFTNAPAESVPSRYTSLGSS